MKRSSTWSPPSVALMKATSVPAERTEAQSILPCHFETSMPWIGCTWARATRGCGFASPAAEKPVGPAQEASASPHKPTRAESFRRAAFNGDRKRIGAELLTQHTDLTDAPEGVNGGLTRRDQEVGKRCREATYGRRGFKQPNGAGFGQASGEPEPERRDAEEGEEPDHVRDRRHERRRGDGRIDPGTLERQGDDDAGKRGGEEIDHHREPDHEAEPRVREPERREH